MKDPHLYYVSARRDGDNFNKSFYNSLSKGKSIIDLTLALNMMGYIMINCLSLSQKEFEVLSLVEKLPVI